MKKQFLLLTYLTFGISFSMLADDAGIELSQESIAPKFISPIEEIVKQPPIPVVEENKTVTVPEPITIPTPKQEPELKKKPIEIAEIKTIPSKKQKKILKKLVNFSFNNEDLVKIINEFAALQNSNIILPTGANAINQKVTLKNDKKITLGEAERYLDTILDIAGYSKVLHGDFYMIVKNDPQVTREPIPLFIDTPPQDLPDTGRIQVVYYLRNIKVPENAQGTDPLNVILNDMLSVNRSYNFDTKSNAVIVSDKASNLKATMNMILELDTMGIRDSIKQIQLFNISATTAASLLQSQIIAVSGTAQGRIRAEVKSESGLYFAPGTKIIGDSRTNSLIIMGKEPAVERVIEFVRGYIDVPIDSGKSILHYYELQYLDAEQFAEVLKKIVTMQGPSGQATTEQTGGPSRAFEGVIIVAEKPVEEVIEKPKFIEVNNPVPGSGSILKGTVYRGGNRIIVAAKSRDWKRIEKLIRDLDKPQYQVIIQVMIIDFTVNENKIFGTQTRNPDFFQLPKGVNFQTTHLVAPPIPFQNTPKPNTLATDLLTLISGITPPASEAAILSNSNTTTGDSGSLILSLNDPSGTGIWTFLQWLNSFGEARVLSHPYLVTRNNTKAEETISTIKRIAGDASTGEGGLLASKQQEIEAALKVSIVPRVSSPDRVNLQISLAINEFIGSIQVTTSNNSLTTRELHTNVNMSSGQMLVIGGLTRSATNDIDNETPLLGRIPIIRWFFSSNVKAVQRVNVSVFIIPTIIEPKIRAGLNKYSKDKINDSYSDLEQGSLFDQLRDPVTYFFFKEPNINTETLDEYLADAAGDFVRRDRIEQRRGPIDKPENVEEKNIMSPDSQKLKAMLAPEQNPILTIEKPR